MGCECKTWVLRVTPSSAVMECVDCRTTVGLPDYVNMLKLRVNALEKAGAGIVRAYVYGTIEDTNRAIDVWGNLVEGRTKETSLTDRLIKVCEDELERLKEVKRNGL